MTPAELFDPQASISAARVDRPRVWHVRRALWELTGQRLLLVALVLALLALASPRSGAAQGLPGTGTGPSTTLAAEAGTNTSASSAFAGQPNGNPAPGNVSKVPTRALLYQGAATRVLAQVVTWYGPANPSYVNPGYRSDDPGQVRRQVDDLLSRGIEGAVLQWNGVANTPLIETATRAWLNEAQSRGGALSVALMVDESVVRECRCADLTARLATDLQQIAAEYLGSPAYLRQGGRPVLFFFNVRAWAIENGRPIDWAALHALLPEALFVELGDAPFTDARFDGAQAWVYPSTNNPSDWGQGILEGLYRAARQRPDRLFVASVFKGFDDRLAPAGWGRNRLMAQDCGQTWLRSFAEVRRFFDASRPLDFLQVTTWNDYAEGTEVESGIDTCVSVDASLAGTRLRWSVQGQENTIHHYTVFVSPDGERLTPVGDVPPGTRAFDLAPLSLPAGEYLAYVQAVGQPSLFNHLSAAVPFTVPLPTPAGGANGGLCPPLEQALAATGAAGLRPGGTEPCVFSRQGASPSTVACPDGWICTLYSARVGAVLVLVGPRQLDGIGDGTWRFAPAYPTSDAVHRPCELLQQERAYTARIAPGLRVEPDGFPCS